ncbi:MAG: xanthine dehydrogenase family protein subunit M [Acidobacteria bacterium]|nr:xanthine dehydrogenase family protein subunit M [Acidobacteriota bacterium]
MDVPVQRVVRPRTLDEALVMLAEQPRSRPIAGGTDLMVQLRDGRRSADTLVDLDGLDLAGVHEVDLGVEIGAATTMDAIARHPLVRRRWPALAEAAALVGAWPIQCRATLGGNLANASPAADAVPPLLVADAAVRLASPSGERTIALERFFRGPGTTVMAPGELIVAVLLPAPSAGRVVERFVKVGPRREQIISMVSLAGRAVVSADGTLHDVRVALGAVAPIPVRARRVEAHLEGRRPDAATRREAAARLQADIAPIDDLRAPAAYRRIAAAVLLDRFLEACHG